MEYKILDLGGLKKQLEVTATVEDNLVKDKFESAYTDFQKIDLSLLKFLSSLSTS